MDQIQQKLFKIESALRILECKLESLPTPPTQPNTSENITTLSSKSAIAQNTSGTFEASTPEVASQEISSQQQSEHAENPVPQMVDNKTSEKSAENTDDDDNKTNKNNVREDPRYAKYFKMMYVGVPPAAIMQKMASEGVDPAILNS